MDIVTHAAMGAVLAMPFLDTHPIAAGCFAMGCVLPDLDVFSRLFGKRAFLRCHQTYTHSLTGIVLATAVFWGGARALGFEVPRAAPALGVGMLLHALLDLTNTYGVTVLAPFSMRRWSLEWVFFIDSVVLTSTAVALLLGLQRVAAGERPDGIVVTYTGVLCAYWAAKALLRARAGRLGPRGTVSLIPSALVPWRFFGYARVDDRVRLFTIDAVTGAMSDEDDRTNHDAAWESHLEALPEYREMRALSPAYHVTDVELDDEGASIVCRDLRTRNFGGRFGTLRVRTDSGGRVLTKTLDV